METFLDIAEELHIKGLTRDKTSSKSTSSATPAKRARTSAQGKVINIVPRPQDYEDSSESYKTSYFEDSTEYAAYDDDYSNSGPSQTYSKPNPPGGQDKVKYIIHDFCEIQCGNFMIFMPFRFYVKSKLADLRCLKICNFNSENLEINKLNFNFT